MVNEAFIVTVFSQLRDYLPMVSMSKVIKILNIYVTMISGWLWQGFFNIDIDVCVEVHYVRCSDHDEEQSGRPCLPCAVRLSGDL